MDDVVTLLKIIGGFIGIGTTAGVLIGKYLVKRAKSKRPPVLTVKEKIIYSSSILLGIAAILFGVFYQFPEPGGVNAGGENAVILDEAAPDGDAAGGNTAGGAAVPRAETSIAIARAIY